MKGLNKVMLLGNLGKDPEITTLENNTTVAKLSLATTETFTNKEGKKETHTEWHTIIVWQKLAQYCQQYLSKGSLVYIEGKMRTRQYEDKEGSTKKITEIIADELILLDKKSET